VVPQRERRVPQCCRTNRVLESRGSSSACTWHPGVSFRQTQSKTGSSALQMKERCRLVVLVSFMFVHDSKCVGKFHTLQAWSVQVNKTNSCLHTYFISETVGWILMTFCISAITRTVKPPLLECLLHNLHTNFRTENARWCHVNVQFFPPLWGLLRRTRHAGNETKETSWSVMRLGYPWQGCLLMTCLSTSGGLVSIACVPGLS
jgi:hypothetical protein